MSTPKSFVTPANALTSAAVSERTLMLVLENPPSQDWENAVLTPESPPEDFVFRALLRWADAGLIKMERAA